MSRLADTDADGPPPGFEPIFRTSPFLDATGPFFYKVIQRGFTVGLRALEKHTNASGFLHGGLVATLADVSLGYVTSTSKTPALRMVTTSLGIDFVGMAKVGDWIESRVSIVKVGSRLAFANAEITSNDAPIASARAVFMVVGAVA